MPPTGRVTIRRAIVAMLVAAAVWWAVSGAGALPGAALLCVTAAVFAAPATLPHLRALTPAGDGDSEAAAEDPTPAATEAEPIPAARPQAVEAGLIPARRNGPPRVLMVDDQEEMLIFVRAFLEAGGYDVVEATNGRQALQVCRRLAGGVDLLLSDIRMPDMNGPELHRRMRTEFPTVRVLYMSGFAPHFARQQGIPEDAALIEKGFTPEELNRQVRAVLADAASETAA